MKTVVGIIFYIICICIAIFTITFVIYHGKNAVGKVDKIRKTRVNKLKFWKRKKNKEEDQDDY